MKKIFILFMSLFFMGQIAISQTYNTTLDYTPDTDCSAVISQAGGSFAFGVDVHHQTSGWQSQQQATSWLSYVDVTYIYEITNTVTGEMFLINAGQQPMESLTDLTLNFDHNTVNGSLEDGTYTIRLITRIKRSNNNSALNVKFTISDLPEGSSTSGFISDDGDTVTYATDIIFCFEYQKCDDVTVSTIQKGNELQANISTTSNDISIVWVIENLNGTTTVINGPSEIQMPATCVTITLTVTDNETGCRYTKVMPCLIEACNLPAPTNFNYQSIITGETAITWDGIMGSNGYKIIIGGCCDSEGNSQPVREFFSFQPRFVVGGKLQLSCFSIQVFPICSDGQLGAGSGVQCFGMKFREDNDAAVRSSSEVEALNVYPNPASDFVQISLSGAIGTTTVVSIFDSNGKTIMNRTLDMNSSNNVIDWNTSDIQSGIYIVRSMNGNTVITKKLIITK